MRIVVDTNVLISGIFWGGIPSEIVRAWAEGNLIAVCSAEIVKDYNGITRRMNPGLALIEVDRLLALLIRHSEIVRPNHWFKIVQDDPQDDKFIDCAFHARAHTVISGDKHLLRLKKFGPVQIMSPAEFKKKNPKIFIKA